MLKSLTIHAGLLVALLADTAEEQDGAMAVGRLREDVLVATADVLPESLPREGLRLLVLWVRSPGLHPVNVLAPGIAIQSNKLVESLICDGPVLD